MGAQEDSAALDGAALLAALRRCDPQGMRTLYARYSDRIFGFLYRLTRDRTLADDLHQETWLAAARHVVNLRADSDPAAWLFTIARNKYRSFFRWTLLSDPFTVPLDEHEPQASYNPRQDVPDDLGDLERALGRLAPPVREVLLLVGCEGLQATQVASILGISPEAVRQRVARARAALLRAMAPDNLADARARLTRRKRLKGA